MRWYHTDLIYRNKYLFNPYQNLQRQTKPQVHQNKADENIGKDVEFMLSRKFQLLEKRNMIVIGASAGGVDALKNCWLHYR